jgi:Fe-S-cluster containining protein
MQTADRAEPRSSSSMQRQDPFAYSCRRCLNCCRHKRIQINPYEAARLAHNRGISTGEFHRRWTRAEGTELAQAADGSCVFLGPGGCSVHADRPLVCRLYPLGRHVMPDGSESYSMLEPHPQSAGVYGGPGCIGDYLQAQDAQPFIAAADAYYSWLCRAQDALAAGLIRADIDSAALLDLDSAIAGHCAASGEPEPAVLEQRLALHLRILEQQLVPGPDAGRSIFYL